ncbi:PREDICTED: KH domain-containing protein HEN4-like [Camelina sativa]|uniref:KH domain-containing protein HEN4-like n=1 Tax=Camelina sativa TaxID=90675 RepID=A0ABM0Y423_CAMSA|nr:PREDICTED: KH domain-containing protein HEN4-like [Camelina sativa]
MEGKKFESTARAPPQSLTAPPAGYAVFRILCDVSQAGGRIGISGRVIHQLQESTKSRIWFEKAPLDSQYRVITILAYVGSTFRLNLGVTVNNASNREKEAQEQEVEVSRAQLALIRVFEALNVGFRTISSVSVMMLLEGSHVVTVIGKGGELLEMIWRETGCNVEIRTHDLPSCAKPDDVMVKIEGKVLAVKKALVSISSRMQACKPISMASLHKHTEAIPDALRRPMDVVPLPRDALSRAFGSITQPRIDSLSQYRISDHRLINSASKNHPVTIKQPLQESEDDIRNVVLKILCPKQSARARSVIKTLQNVRDASISVSDTLSDCDERLITITASEDPEDKNSPAQRAMILVFTRIYEIATETKDFDVRSSITARLVVRTYKINCFVGRDGCIASKIQKGTGAKIEVLEVEQNPKCVPKNTDQVVQISGGFSNVKEAINQVTSRLRENLIFHSFEPVDADPCIIPEDPSPNRVSPTALNFGRLSTMDLNDASHYSSQADPYGLWASRTPSAPRGVYEYDGSGGLSSTRDDLGFYSCPYSKNRCFCSGLRASNVTNKTVQYRVSENAVNSVFGDGHNGHTRLQELCEVRNPYSAHKIFP